MLYTSYYNQATQLFGQILAKHDEPIVLSEANITPNEIMAILSMIYYSTTNSQLRTMITECIKALVKLQASGARFDVASAQKMASIILR